MTSVVKKISRRYDIEQYLTGIYDQLALSKITVRNYVTEVQCR